MMEMVAVGEEKENVLEPDLYQFCSFGKVLSLGGCLPSSSRKVTGHDVTM